MKGRFEKWGQVAAQAAKPIPQFLIRAHPGIEDLERKLLFSKGNGDTLPAEIEEFVDRISVQLFGVKRQDTEFPDSYYLRQKRFFDPGEYEHECQYETAELDQEEVVWFLKQYGLDFTGSDGQPLRCTWHLKRQAEAAAKGIMGKMPDREKAAVDSFASRLEAEAKAFKSRKR
jgi:hypothetical protein